MWPPPPPPTLHFPPPVRVNPLPPPPTLLVPAPLVYPSGTIPVAGSRLNATQAGSSSKLNDGGLGNGRVVQIVIGVLVGAGVLGFCCCAFFGWWVVRRAGLRASKGTSRKPAGESAGESAGPATEREGSQYHRLASLTPPPLPRGGRGAAPSAGVSSPVDPQASAASRGRDIEAGPSVPSASRNGHLGDISGDEARAWRERRGSWAHRHRPGESLQHGEAHTADGGDQRRTQAAPIRYAAAAPPGTGGERGRGRGPPFGGANGGGPNGGAAAPAGGGTTAGRTVQAGVGGGRGALTQPPGGTALPKSILRAPKYAVRQPAEQGY